MYQYSEQDVFEGWQPKVKEAIEKIKAAGGTITQVKEKFGGLRIYTHGGDQDLIDRIITEAEHWCERHCEYCGGPGASLEIKGWWKTACKACAANRLKLQQK